MNIYYSLDEYRQTADAGKAKPSAVTIGKFDGIHIGHLKLIRQITEIARQKRLESVVFSIVSKDASILSSSERGDYLGELGVDTLIECPFHKQFMDLSAEEFVRVILKEMLHAEYISVGKDFAFGHNREGNTQTLKTLGNTYGFETKILEKEQYLHEDVSSTRVRNALKQGDMELVFGLLGRPYPISGIVEHGRHLGTTIGVPTANVVPQPSKLLPPDGVYASYTILPDRSVRKGLTNLGVRPTVGGRSRRAETTLMEYEGDLYGSRIETYLFSYIRPEIKFSGLEELEKQIEKDKQQALQILCGSEYVKSLLCDSKAF